MYGMKNHLPELPKCECGGNAIWNIGSNCVYIGCEKCKTTTEKVYADIAYCAIDKILESWKRRNNDE